MTKDEGRGIRGEFDGPPPKDEAEHFELCPQLAAGAQSGYTRRLMSMLPIADVLKEHMALTREHKSLMRQVAELRDIGKTAAAQRLMKRTRRSTRRSKSSSKPTSRRGLS